ncbi:hypothetical protein KQX54_011521 [Cotesia glomerata]|uniref:Uncharacterized protein n=1 Tax=Cotesia glomerata TaxID=32391 RepID=A0AAV7IVH6_COTGL|nr:hypothetical protein KQX54_011521 [Cotesia glomerata]
MKKAEKKNMEKKKKKKEIEKRRGLNNTQGSGLVENDTRGRLNQPTRIEKDDNVFCGDGGGYRTPDDEFYIYIDINIAVGGGGRGRNDGGDEGDGEWVVLGA